MWWVLSFFCNFKYNYKKIYREYSYNNLNHAGSLKMSFSDYKFIVGKLINWANLFSHHLPSFKSASRAWSLCSYLELSKCLLICEATLEECSYLIKSLFGQSFKLIKANNPITFSVYFTNRYPFLVNGNNYSRAV